MRRALCWSKTGPAMEPGEGHMGNVGLEYVVAAKELFSERYLTVAEANRRNYANVARHYVKYMAKIDSPELLAEDLRRALGRLGNLGRKPVALDACGGSGDAALMLQQLGCDVLLVDISPEMIGFYKEACATAGFGAETQCSEIGSFFTRTQRRFDLIVFRSALHHLEDPVLVLQLAQKTLSPNGLIVTIFDPVKRPRWVNMAVKPLLWIRRAMSSPKLILTRPIPVLRNMIRGGQKYKDRRKLEITDANVGMIAEFHAGRGFDDKALVERITSTANLSVLHHDYYTGRCGMLEKMIYKVSGSPRHFKLLLQNAESAGGSDQTSP
ncbi:MAG: class I SAM-dependent methyltransferase [Planctomycetes bacterium]|nr:class I SAM-dependent methyltransferase [Planctomycetota bacterium]